MRVAAMADADRPMLVGVVLAPLPTAHHGLFVLVDGGAQKGDELVGIAAAIKSRSCPSW
jgi:hypothetical protein